MVWSWVGNCLMPGRGRTLIDRRLYLPASRADDRERCGRAGIDDEVALETKVAMARAAGPAGAGLMGPACSTGHGWKSCPGTGKAAGTG